MSRGNIILLRLVRLGPRCFADTDDGELGEGPHGEAAGDDGDVDDTAPRGRLSWGTSEELGVTGGGGSAAAPGPRTYTARMPSGGVSTRRPRPRQPRACLSPTAVPPANISFATLVSPEATPRGRRPWFRSGEALAIGKQQTLGVLEPLHPKLRPVVVQEPGMPPLWHLSRAMSDSSSWSSSAISLCLPRLRGSSLSQATFGRRRTLGPA